MSSSQNRRKATNRFMPSTAVRPVFPQSKQQLTQTNGKSSPGSHRCRCGFLRLRRSNVTTLWDWRFGTSTHPKNLLRPKGSASPIHRVGGTINCALDNLANGASVTVAIVVTPRKAGTLINTAQVSSTSPDPDLNNSYALMWTGYP